MKKTVSIILAILFVFSSFVCFAESDLTLKLDGKLMETDVPPVIVNDRTMVPFRAIFEELGISVNWSGALRKVYATADDITVILTVDSEKMIVNENIITLEAAPFIMNDRVLVPVRAVCEALKCTVDWEADTRTVIIKTKDYVEPSFNETIGSDPAYVKKDIEFDKSLFEAINAERKKLGIPELLYDETLAGIALSHSTDMAKRDYIDHTDPDGVGPFDRIDKASVSYVAAAENIASGFSTAAKVVESWLNSPKHSANILNAEFNKIGVGYFAGGSNGTYWTVVLISD